MQLNKLIDHTILKTDATSEQIDKLIAEAREYNFASVCVSPLWVARCHEGLKDTDVDVCTVIGFPQGTHTTESKAFETEDAINKGATEVDMVIAVGKLKEGDLDYVTKDIKAVVDKAHAKNVLVKVIIESCLLTDDEIVKACECSVKANADFVKTSTGFSTGGATTHAVSLMRKTVGEKVGVKASGGVRTKEDAEAMVNAGANRIGTSNGVTIVKA